MKQSSYLLESEAEFERLEGQSRHHLYDFRRELRDFKAKDGELVLDAGCGTGIVTRYLAEISPASRFVGCDFAGERLNQAKKAAAHLKNIDFRVEDIQQLDCPNSNFDQIVCRYVLEHLSVEGRAAAAKEFYRCLKPGGRAHIVDVDGLLHNIYPQTPIISKAMSLLEGSGAIDLKIGRKIPEIMLQAGFDNVTWSVQTVNIQGNDKAAEVGFCGERLRNAFPFFSKMLGSESEASKFSKEYLRIIEKPEATLFYNMFIVVGEKLSSRSGLSVVR